jgi:hypothetical protein
VPPEELVEEELDPPLEELEEEEPELPLELELLDEPDPPELEVVASSPPPSVPPLLPPLDEELQPVPSTRARTMLAPANRTILTICM